LNHLSSKVNVSDPFNPKFPGPKGEFSLEQQGFAVEFGVQISDYIRMSSMKLGV
jgi:hypothetical protein